MFTVFLIQGCVGNFQRSSPIGFHVQKSANERYSIYILDTV